MEEKLQNINHIVVVGAWNQAILTEKWVKVNILNDVENYTIEYPISGSGSLRYVTDDFSFHILPGRLLVSLNKATEHASMKAVEYARRILRLLVHTPVEAMGINFVFERDGRCKVFDALSDTEALAASVGKPAKSVEITRHFPLGEKETLNFTVAQKGDKSVFNFNFDFKAHSPLDVINAFGDEDDIIVRKRQAAMKIVGDVYGEGAQ